MHKNQQTWYAHTHRTTYLTVYDIYTTKPPAKASGSDIEEIKIRSGKRDSNPRHSAWEADALPTELLPHKTVKAMQNYVFYFGSASFLNNLFRTTR